MKRIVPILLIVVGILVYFYKDEVKAVFASTPQSLNRYDKVFKVKRGDFLITLNIPGTLEPIKRYDIKPRVNSRWPFEITFIVDNNVNVKKGDVICRFSSESFQKDLDDYKIDLENEGKNLNVARDELNAQEFNNMADIKNAAVAFRQAREALVRFRDEDSLYQKKTFIRKLDQLEKNVKSAEVAFQQSVNSLNENQDQNLAKALENVVQQKKKSLQQVEEARDKAFYELRVFKKYTFKEKTLKLEEAVTKAELGLDNAVIKARFNELKSQENINIISKKIARLKANIRKEENILSSLELRAPFDGIFTKKAVRRGSSLNEYLVGAEVRFGQTIGSLPDMSQFRVNCKVPEAYRSFVKTGLIAEIKIKSIPTLKLTGKIEEISTIAVHEVYWNEDTPKIYPTKILTKDTDPRLTPNMSVRVDIIIDDVKQVLFVPVEAVYNREGDTCVRIESDGFVKEVKVKTGRSSLDNVEIIEGLKEGDSVVLDWESVD